ncbi:MAG: protein YacH [Bacillota bacterium]|nr:MAG: protein YacH [Bacillota bacterium]MBS3949591.1 UvrB/UvrC motif-containing protein [Peptococcaceae bacterium]
MLCEECKAQQATVHYTQVVNGEKTEMHLCEDCAKARSDIDILGFPGTGFNINSLLAGLMNFEHGPTPAKLRAEACSTCGADYNRFTQSGRLGCADCYKTFAKQISPLLKRIHGTTAHHGKVPSKGAKEISRKRRLTNLKLEQRAAVESEQYEKAAELRDQIRKLELDGQ